ncbi:hypothetical protein DUNSADRAFT_10487 [Dunaliella salina]|uniref:Uncharacterized protein n=1 Tax=Dunaliella salina TaxID=3046 RepID=A0ABQ7GF71_DUNSA|nr:hypothetical protein DUNSADRAFT_10487 [Dunaliella salina]|eukprot:KAF5833249.1 hypothetical protein DUNSADRAFT_10487 [Dunaliella salina]
MQAALLSSSAIPDESLLQFMMRGCFDKSELQVSEVTKREIAQHLGVPLEPVLVRDPGTSQTATEAGAKAADDTGAGMRPATVRRAAVALQRAGAKMPVSRREELAGTVREGLQLSGWIHPGGSAPIDPSIALSAVSLNACLLSFVRFSNACLAGPPMRDEGHAESDPAIWIGLWMGGKNKHWSYDREDQ